MRVWVASDSSLIRRQLRDAVCGLGLECAATDTRKLMQRPVHSPVIDLVVMEIGANLQGALAAVHHHCACRSSPFYLVCDDWNTADIPQLLRAGANGYLRLSHAVNDLQTVIDELCESNCESTISNQVIAITGATPGIGATTVATNLAFALAADLPGRVALFQLDRAGEMHSNLQLQPRYPLHSLASSWNRLDVKTLQRWMVDHPAGVSVLADQFDDRSGCNWSPPAIRQTLTVLRSAFDFVVIDVGYTRDLSALRFADQVALVLKLDEPAVNQTNRYLDFMIAGGVSAEGFVGIVNRFGQEQQLAWEPVQERLGIEIVEWVPDFPALINRALNSGRPLISLEPGAAITKSFARLADRCRRHSQRSHAIRQFSEVG